MADTDFIDDLMVDEGGEKTVAETKEQQDAALNSRIDDAITKKEKGFYNEMRAERQKRQEIQSQLDKLTGTLNVILETRKTALSQVPDGKAKKFNGIPVAETEDGDLYIPEEHLAPLVSARDEKIRNLEMLLQRTNASQNAETEAEKIKAAMVGEDAGYGPAYQKYQAARKWASDQVVAFQRENGINGLMSSGQALDYVFDEHLEKEFSEKFPGLPLDEVVTAEDSQRNFRRMLKSVAKASATDDPRKGVDTLASEKFKKLLRKPSGLGSSTNAKSGHINVSEKLESLSPQDIMNLTDAQAKALQEALLSEEKEGGLSF